VSDVTEHSSEGVPYPVLVRQHVWESLVSMLRVYSHAASLNGQELVVTGISDEAWVKCHGCALSLSFRSETGEATWRVTQPDLETWGEFRIEEDGTLNFPAGPKQLDTAAIDWVEHLVRAASPAADEHLGHPLRIS
jgi:hypothetical protein